MKDDLARNAGSQLDLRQKGSHCQPIIDVTEWITKAEAARIRGVSRQAIGKLVSKGQLATLEIAGQTLVKRTEVEVYIAKPGGRPAKL